MAGERILIIDDKIEIINFLVDLLDPLGYALSHATDGRTGLAKLQEEPPDLILLDLNMPGMSGLDVLEKLHRQGAQLPVILMTLYGSEEAVVRALRLGVRDYISKPFDINELLVSIDWALEESRLRNERERLLFELQEANQKLAQHMGELVTLQAVGHSVASLMPRSQVNDRILDAVVHLTGADAGAIFLLDLDKSTLHLEAVRHEKTIQANLQAPVRDSYVNQVIESGQALWVSPPTRSTGLTNYLGQALHSLLYVPICLGEQVIGVIAVAGLARKEYLPAEIESRLRALADYAAIALTNARLYEDAQRRTRQLAAVNRIAQTVVSSLELDDVVRSVVREVRRTLRAGAAALALVPEEGAAPVFEVVDGDHDLAAFRSRLGQRIARWVVDYGQPLRLDDMAGDPRFAAVARESDAPPIRSLLCVPLALSDRVAGAIAVVDREDGPRGRGQFSAQDGELLNGVAAFVAMALENARLHAARRKIVAAETLQETVVTLCHYVNNPLQSLMGAAELLRAADLPDLDALIDSEGEVDVIQLVERKVREISVVLSVLRDLTKPESTVYLGSTQMLDIQQELRRRLSSADDRPLADL
ncbi:MAG: response regulator [Anaerolineae bacterium]|jgi:CheY-like chemotaxis protein